MTNICLQEALVNSMVEIERWDLRVGLILLNPEDLPEVSSGFERCNPEPRLEWGSGGLLVGKLWNIPLVVSPSIERGCVDVIPEGGKVLSLYRTYQKYYGDIRDEAAQHPSRFPRVQRLLNRLGLL